MNLLKMVIICVALMNPLFIYAQDFSTHQWENRILILNSEGFKNDTYQMQLDDLREQEAGLLERKLLIYQLKENQYKIGLTDNNQWLPIDKKAPQIFNKKRDFAVILIGLDGWKKLEQSEILPPNELFKLIDSMPMRIQEIKNLNKN